MGAIQPRPVACDCTRTYISLELDGELSELERRFLEAHVDRCESCRAFRADVHMLTTHIREAVVEAPSRRVRISAHVESRLPIHRLGAVAAAFVVVVGTTALLTPTTDTGQRVHGQPEFRQSSPNEVGFVIEVQNRGETYGPGMKAPKARSTGVDFIV
jgi:anti-sigma factor RsiW